MTTRTRLRLFAVVAFVAVVGVTGCSSGSLPAAAAKVGPSTITENQLSDELAALAGNHAYVSRLQVPGGVYGDGPDGLSSAFVAEILTNEIDSVAAENLLAQRHAPVLAPGPTGALTEATFGRAYGGLSFNSFPAAYRATLARRTGVAYGLAASVNHVDLSVAALMRYREAHLAQFGRYCVSAVLLPSRTGAAAAAHAIQSGTAFATEAKRKSLDSTARRGGRLGCGTSGMFDTAFTHYLVTGALGAVSPPIHDPQGWYVLDLTSRHTRTLDEAAPDIVTALLPANDVAFTTAIAKYLKTEKVTVAKNYGYFNAAANPPAVVPPS